MVFNGIHFLSEKINDRFSNWKCGPPVYGSSYWNWNGRWGNPPPGRRAGPAGCPTTAIAGTCCTFTGIYTHTAAIRVTLQTQIVIFWERKYLPAGRVVAVFPIIFILCKLKQRRAFCNKFGFTGGKVQVAVCVSGRIA